MDHVGQNNKRIRNSLPLCHTCTFVYYNILRKSFSSREDIKGLPIVPIDGTEHLNIMLHET